MKGVLIFSNFFSLKRKLDKIPESKILKLDLSEVRLIDHSTMDHLHQFKREYDKTGGTMELTGLHAHKAASDHPLASRKLTKSA